MVGEDVVAVEELNTMLANLADDGALESSGVFTLSPEKAMEKLAAFRLASPGLFVLNLVAAAVSANATRFSIETRGGMTRFDFDPKLEPSEGQLQGLFALILDPAAPAFLRELALAVHGASGLTLQPAIRLFVTTSKLSRELVIRGGNVGVSPAPPRPPGITLQLEYPEQSGWSSLFSRKADPQAEVVKHVFHFCRFAPLTITNNGKSEGSPVTGGASDSAVFAWRHLVGTQAMRAVPATPRTDLTISRKRTSPLASSIVLTLRGDQWSANEGFLLISRGVVFKRHAAKLDFPLARAVVTADQLEKNLSQSDLVEGPDYESLIQVLRDEVEDLILEVCSKPPRGWSDEVRRVFCKALQDRYSTVKAPRQVETFYRLEDMQARCETVSGQEEQMQYWRELSPVDSASAGTFRKELRSAIRAVATRRLSAQHWQDAHSCLQRLKELGAPPEPALDVALLYLQGDTDGVNCAVSSGALDTHMTLLLGGVPSGKTSDPLSQLLLFEQAVDRGDLASADEMAGILKDLDGTSVLFLWLGWYCVYRERVSEAGRNWDRAVRLMGGEEGQVWSAELWKELSGKVSFGDEVRWRVSRSFESWFLAADQRAGRYRAPSNLSVHPTLWAATVWRARIAGNQEKARDLFVKGYLKSLVDLYELRLSSPRAGLGPLAFFRST